MATDLRIIKTDIAEKRTQILFYEIVRHALQECIKANSPSRTALKKDVIALPAFQTEFMAMLRGQLRRSNNFNYIALLGRELNLAAKHKKGSVFQLLLLEEWVLLLYEPPVISLPYRGTPKPVEDKDLASIASGVTLEKMLGPE